MIKIKLAILSIHPAPYRDPFYNELAKRADLELTVWTYYNYDQGHKAWNLDTLKYNNIFFKSRINLFGNIFFLDILKIFSKSYDYIVIPGFSEFTSISAIFLAILLRKKFIITADTIQDNRKSVFLKKIKKSILNRSSFIWVPGKASEYYFHSSFNIESKKILLGSYALDNKKIEEQVETNILRKKKIQQAYNIPLDADIFLMVGNFLPNRNYMQLFTCFNFVKNKIGNCFLLVVGDGDEKSKIEAYTQLNNLYDYKIINSCSFAELIDVYIASDIYVHTGCEPYSTALALAFFTHKPIISNINIGAAQDYLIDGVTGYYYDANNNDSLISKMQELLDKKRFNDISIKTKELAFEHNLLDSVDNMAQHLIQTKYL
jgi:glycosyltransferase involved in cell wall biosynthesis